MSRPKEEIVNRNSQRYHYDAQKSLPGIIDSQKEKYQRNQHQEQDRGDGVTRRQIFRSLPILSP
jgi:hypothetical protein